MGKIFEVKLSGRNLIEEINTGLVPPVIFSVPFFKIAKGRTRSNG